MVRLRHCYLKVLIYSLPVFSGAARLSSVTASDRLNPLSLGATVTQSFPSQSLLVTVGGYTLSLVAHYYFDQHFVILQKNDAGLNGLAKGVALLCAKPLLSVGCVAVTERITTYLNPHKKKQKRPFSDRFASSYSAAWLGNLGGLLLTAPLSNEYLKSSLVASASLCGSTLGSSF